MCVSVIPFRFDRFLDDLRLLVVPVDAPSVLRVSLQHTYDSVSSEIDIGHLGYTVAHSQYEIKNLYERSYGLFADNVVHYDSRYQHQDADQTKRRVHLVKVIQGFAEGRGFPKTGNFDHVEGYGKQSVFYTVHVSLLPCTSTFDGSSSRRRHYFSF